MKVIALGILVWLNWFVPKKSKPKPPVNLDCEKFPVGAGCVIVKPAILWQGMKCVVLGESGGVHLVKVKGANGHDFHAEISGEYLRYDL